MALGTLAGFVVGPLILFCFIRFGWRLMPVGVASLVMGVVGMGMVSVSLGTLPQEEAARGDVPAAALIGFALMRLAFLMTIVLGVVFVARRLSGEK